MNDESRILKLLEEVLDSQLTPEEVCLQCPELLPSLKDKLARFRSMDAQLEGMFPSSRSSPAKRRPAHILSQLPEIPGYQVEAILGRGGIGIVYRARHLNLRRWVALKMLLSGEYASALELTRFMREARSVAALRHPNIVQVHDVGDLDGRPFYTMELIDGGTLAQKLAGAPQPAREAAAMARILAQAVNAAHQAGIVHRDLKPGNVLLTAEGAPKISDFGLARQLDENASLTLNGARLGTPSYMAPEQASGTADAICTPVDIYALGTILYETLTGRPPFRGETTAETERQVISDEPVAPSRLNKRVPRDLETICLKCLNKSPKRRYLTAQALAEDLHRFLLGEPIAARRTRVPERGAMWARRNPALATGIAAALIISVSLTCGLIHSESLRAKRVRAVELDLRELADLETLGQWPQAQATLSRARARLDNGVSDRLLQRLNSAQQDLDLVQRLDEIRLSRATSGGLPFYRNKSIRDYTSAFAKAGLPAMLSPLDSAAAQLKASAIRGALVCALDDWSVTTNDPAQSSWLLELARRTDPEPRPTGDRLRDTAAWKNAQSVEEVTRTVSVDGNSVSGFLALAERLRELGGDPSDFLDRIQKQHPADFWANLSLGNALLQTSPYEAANYHRAALAARPNVAAAYCAVGDALLRQSHFQEATEYFQKALSINANDPCALTNLGIVLRELGRTQESIAAFEKSLQIDPDYAWTHVELATALAEIGQFDQAMHQFAAVPVNDFRYPVIENEFRGVLVRQGHGEEALAEWKKVLDGNPSSFDEWNGYAELCLFLGHQDTYGQTCAALLKRFGSTDASRVAEPIARTCLLRPSNTDQTQEATKLANRAVKIDRRQYDYFFGYSMFAKGLSDYRVGNFSSAISIMQHNAYMVMGPCPQLIAAMASQDKGETANARKLLASAVTHTDWSLRNADTRDVWIKHILRREAETKILPDLSQVIAGTAKPTDNDERLALTGLCQAKDLQVMRMHLFADAFAADPKLTDSVDPDLLFQAACSAEAAADGRGADVSSLTDLDRATMRAQAYNWLAADLPLKLGHLNLGDHDSCAQLRRDLKLWRSTPDLAGLRDASDLPKVPADERDQIGAFWKSVDRELNLLAHDDRT